MFKNKEYLIKSLNKINCKQKKIVSQKVEKSPEIEV